MNNDDDTLEGGAPEETVTEGGPPPATEEDTSDEDNTPDEPAAAAAPEPATPETDEQGADDEPVPEEASAAEEAPASKNDNTIDVIGHKRRPPTPQELDNEDALYAQDLKRGHIKPETMADLFAKKDTLGKVSTLFGLLLAGAGSGLTGQPNAVLEMMKNEINNDFQAQRESNANAQNWLRLSQQHEMQKAHIQQMGLQNELTKAQTGKIPAEIELTKAQASKAPSEIAEAKSRTAQHYAEAQVLAQTAALNKMQLSVLQHLQDKVVNMPDGVAKDNAAQTLSNVVGPAVQQDIQSANAQTSAKLTAAAALRGDLPKPPQPPINLEKFNLLQQMGQIASSKGLPGGLQGGDVAEATKEAEKVADNRAVYDLYQDSFQKLNGAFAGSKLNSQFRQAELATLGAEIARATAGRYNAQEATAQADGMFPSWKDWGQARGEKFRKATQFFKAQEAGTPTLDRFGLKTPFPAQGGKQPKEGATGVHKNGKPTVFKNGEWTFKNEGKEKGKVAGK